MDLPPAMTVLVVAGVLLTLAVTVVAIMEYPSPLALPIALLTGSAAVWALPFALAFHSEELGQHLILQRIRYIGTVVVPVAYYIIAMRYAGNRRYIQPRILGPLAVIGGATLVLVWTNGVHGLFWQSVAVENIGGVWTTTFDYGPWFWIHLMWSYVLILVALGVLIREILLTEQHHRNQALIVFLGGAIPFGFNVVYFVDIGVGGAIDLTPIAIAIGGSIVGLGLLLLELVELRPVARDQVIEQLHDGVIVLDMNEQIRDSNPVAQDILTSYGIDLDTNTDLPDELTSHGGEIEATVDGDERWYRIDLHEFRDPAGQEAGRIVYFNDITEIARREQRISVLHRVLRHNIRNEMTVLLGHLEYVQRAADGPITDDVMAVERSADKIMSFAENARLIERTLKQGDETVVVDAVDCINNAIEYVPNGDREIDLALEAESRNGNHGVVSAVDRELLRRAIGELIENAVVHGSGEVDVELVRRDGWVDVRVLDEGPGIPGGEVEALHAPVETALDHGSGLGLWVARWTADLCGGELRFEDQPEHNVVCMRLPLAT